MEFGSSYINYDVSDSEEEIAVESTRRLVYSDCDDDEEPAIEEPKVDIDRPFASRTTKVKKLDTNIIELALGTALQEKVPVMTGDPIFCSSCRCAFSSVSKITKPETKKEEADTQKNEEDSTVGIWICEFCGNETELTVDEDELPREESNDYIINSAVQGSRIVDDVKEENENRSGLTIFVIDISGSMCLTQESQGKQKLKGFERFQQRNREFNPEGEDQYLPNEQRDISYISRLQCVQAAVDSQIEQLAKDQPTSKVCLISFNNEVTIIGDGTQDALIITGDRLSNSSEIQQVSKQFSVKTTISESAEKLREKVFALEETGSTALGPAVLAAVALGSQVPGSRVIVCTDGVANCGVGSLDVEDGQLEQVEQFYNTVGDLAATSGVSVGVISIKGENCRMEYLSALADRSGGKINIVDPLNLISEFSSILAEPLIAVNVSLTVILHPHLYDRNEPKVPKLEEPCDFGDQKHQQKASIIEKTVGNVTQSTTSNFEFGVKKYLRNDQNLQISEIPFQIQIKFRRLSDGFDLIRVISKTRKVTRDRVEAEKHADLFVFGNHATQSSVSYSVQGEYSKARASAYLAKEKLKSLASAQNDQAQLAHYSAWKADMSAMENTLQGTQTQELQRGLCLSDEEDEDMMEIEENVQKKNAMIKRKEQARKKSRNDAMTLQLFGMSHGYSSPFNNKNA